MSVLDPLLSLPPAAKLDATGEPAIDVHRQRQLQSAGDGQQSGCEQFRHVRPAAVTKKTRSALVLVPLRTDYPNFDPFSPNSGLNQILARTRSLLPVEDFNVYFQTEQVEKPTIDTCFCLPPVYIKMKPFYFPDDQELALLWMAVRNALSSNPSGGKDVHCVGTVPRQVTGFNGIGGAPGVKLSDLEIDGLPDFLGRHHDSPDALRQLSRGAI